MGSLVSLRVGGPSSSVGVASVSSSREHPDHCFSWKKGQFSTARRK